MRARPAERLAWVQPRSGPAAGRQCGHIHGDEGHTQLLGLVSTCMILSGRERKMSLLARSTKEATRGCSGWGVVG
jgi:hypothetical protein